MLKESIEKLGKEFPKLNWAFLEKEINGKKEVISYWPGKEDEDIMICVLKAPYFKEVFHRQDFFFINYAYKNNYEVLSKDSDNIISIKENDCYIGQPFNGYALLGDNKDKEDIIVIGILIKSDVFMIEFLPSISLENKLFDFIFEQENNNFSENCIHISFDKDHPVRKLIEIAVEEYVNQDKQTSSILKALTLSILMYLNKAYLEENKTQHKDSTINRIIQYIRENVKAVTLLEIADRFSYHPNYVSNLLKEKTGKSFSEIRLEERMKKAELLLKETDLTINEIALLLGYSNTGNFYKAFQNYYHVSPRNLV